MARDRFAVIWTTLPGQPVKMADMVMTQYETRITYTTDYIASRLPGVSILASPSMFSKSPVIYKAKATIPFYPRLVSMIPSNGANNIQRRILTKLFDSRGMSEVDIDWQLLMLTGRNTIGHLDIFPHDDSAIAFYGKESQSVSKDVDRSTLWGAIRDEINNVPIDDYSVLAEAIGPTPSANGMIPKMLVAIPNQVEWDGTFTRAKRFNEDEPELIDVIMKIEPAHYPHSIELEHLALQLHDKAGFETPRFWKTQKDGLNILAIERFDRNVQGLPLPLEPLFSIFAIGDRQFVSNDSIQLDNLGERIEKLSTVASIYSKAVNKELFRRIVLALVTGNGDMHMDNISLITRDNQVEISPIYDPAPMRAYSQHDIRFAIPYPISSNDPKTGVLALGKSFGISPPETLAICEEMLGHGKSFLSQVKALKVSEAVKNQLVRVMTIEHELVQTVIK